MIMCHDEFTSAGITCVSDGYATYFSMLSHGLQIVILVVIFVRVVMLFMRKHSY